MATKTLFKVRHLNGMGYAAVDTGEQDISAALRGIARWLDDHPYTVLVALNINIAANDDECYITAIFDGLEEEDFDTVSYRSFGI